MKNHRKLGTAEFLLELNNLIKQADGHEADFGFTVAMITNAKAVRDALEANEAAKTTIKAEAKSLTTQGKATRAQANDMISLFKVTSASKQIPAAKQQEIGFGDDDLIPSKINIFAPAALVVTGSSNGTNKTKWNDSGNKRGTIYNVEALIGAATDFVIVGTSTPASFEHKNQKPGVKAIYRVRAQRGDDFSDYSNEAVVYNS